MEDNKRDTIHPEIQKEDIGVSRKTGRHTWIGDKDEIAPGQMNRPVARTTFIDVLDRETRLVEKQKKPYKGFITDDELREAEELAEAERKARAKERAAKQELAKTRVYAGLGTGLDDDKDTDVEEVSAEKKKPRTLRIADSNKFSRLVWLGFVLVLLLIYEISFFVMNDGAATLPDKTARLKAQTEQLQEENAQLQAACDEYGDYDQVKELRDSWQKTKDQLAE